MFFFVQCVRFFRNVRVSRKAHKHGTKMVPKWNEEANFWVTFGHSCCSTQGSSQRPKPARRQGSRKWQKCETVASGPRRPWAALGGPWRPLALPGALAATGGPRRLPGGPPAAPPAAAGGSWRPPGGGLRAPFRVRLQTQEGGRAGTPGSQHWPTTILGHPQKVHI